MSEQYFHLTIGPVQTFVAQARRTRDFWAGSFILSFLSSVAMSAVRQQSGEILFPVPDDNYLKWLEGTAGPEDPCPVQGSVPNRFKALAVAVGEDFEPGLVVDAIQSAWQTLAELVWEGDLAPVVTDPVHREIWDRQIARFWDISWCLTGDRNQSDLLDRRKNWRSHILADEPGVKCSLMEGFQELSGAARPGEPVRRFWRRVRQEDVSLARDLREEEHLCAIAFVKRRFAYYFHQFEMELPSVAGRPGKQLLGWELPCSVPSVAYLAAAPWLAASIRAVAGDEHKRGVISALQESLDCLDAPREGRVLSCIQQACTDTDCGEWRWSHVAGQYLFEPALQQLIREARKPDSPSAGDIEYLEAVLRHLRQLKAQTGLGDPSPFYAVLLMDGDSLGAQMSDPAKQKRISLALNAFNRQVPDIVRQHSGFLVYAGGDDVLALLPQPDAIACAVALHKNYDRCFDEQNRNQNEPAICTSLSGAIEFAHYKAPLTQILEDAHQLLDDVAKDQTGRNSLAIRVWKPGGLFAQWSAPWPYAEGLSRVADEVARHLHGELSRSFFFKLENLITQLGLYADHVFDEPVVKSLVRSAWTHTGNRLDDLPPDMDQTLLEVCRVVCRVTAGDRVTEDRSNRFSPDALRLLQFLGTENRAFTTLPSTTGTEEEAV